jgi:DNA-binding transcriptional LysR family regulator
MLGPAIRAKVAVEDLISTAASWRTGETGRVRLGTGATACIYLLPGMLAEFRRRMPRLEITVATGNSVQICEQVEAGLLDAGLVTLPVRAPRTLLVIWVREDPLVALFPDGLAPESHTAAPELLASLPLILYESGGSTRAIVDEWFRTAGLVAIPTMELGSVEAIKVLVGQGLGVSVIPQLAASVRTPGTQVRPLVPGLNRRLGLVLRRGKVMDRGVRLLAEALAGTPHA